MRFVPLFIGFTLILYYHYLLFSIILTKFYLRIKILLRRKSMQSLRELYKIGRGPSSSHTMGPERAVNVMKGRYPQADFFKVTLYGSLALTGRGHRTDEIIIQTFEPVKC